jgi:biotin carboxyl carrier protein
VSPARPESTTAQICCDIPGILRSVAVTVGQPVSAGDEIGVLESMKMEIPILAPVSGVVVQVDARPGDALPTGHVLAVVATGPVPAVSPAGGPS